MGRRAATAIAVGLLLAGAAQAASIPQAPASAGAPVSIQVDLNKPLGPAKPLYAWFGYDEANSTTLPGGRKLLRELHDLSPVPVTIRAHHLLTSGDGTMELKWSSTNVYTEDANGRPVYDFKVMDAIFDAWKEIGVTPMVELGFMPKDLASDRGVYQVHFPANTLSGAVQSPPKDYAKWQGLARAVTAHLVQRYGADTVRGWYFEVWNEPDIQYWHGTPQEYWKLYDYAVAGVRAALPGAKVGGPASTGPGAAKAEEFLDGFLGHVSGGKSAADGKPVPLDFISYHAKGRPSMEDGHVVMGIAKEMIDVDKGFAVIARYPRFQKLPIILSEADPEGCAACSARANPANAYRNGTLFPAYTAAAYKRLFELEARRKVNLLAMLSWTFEFDGHDYFEGFRSLATNGIDKPILNVFRMLAMTGGARVAVHSDGARTLDQIMADGVRQTPDIDAFATRAGRAAAVMLWNYHDADGPAAAAPVTLTLAGLPAGLHRVRMEHYRIDDSHSNAYSLWKAMGSPQDPTPEQYAALKARDGLELMGSPAWLDVDHGKLTVVTSMPRQSVSLLHLTW